MNTGIQDMINLGWKLAFVLQQEASPELRVTSQLSQIGLHYR